MKKHITISIDAMGGDNAPASVIEGVSIALSRFSNVDFLLFGDKELLFPLMNQCRIPSKRCKIIHTSEFVKSDDKPSMVVRHGRNTSMWMSIDAVKKGLADAVVSAGNTGALMIMAKFCLSTMKGIERPAICTALPNQKSQTIMLDLGANAECNANNLVQFAIMGSVFCRALYGIERPKVGLLNIGSEETKGLDSIKEAATRLREAKDLSFDFEGFAEGTDIFPGRFDVIATDGFSGNIALKSIEGSMKFIMKSLKQTVKASLLAKVGAIFMIPAFLKLKKRLDPGMYNGAMFMGLNGIAVKSHGGADAKSFANAIKVAINLSNNDVISRIKAEMDTIGKDAKELETNVIALSDNNLKTASK